MADINKNIAPKFDASQEYDLGDVVNIDDKLYAYCGKEDGFKEVYLADLIRGKAESKLNLEPVLLWENPSPTSNFAGQTISLDLAEYEGVIIECDSSINNHVKYGTRVYVKKGDANICLGRADENGETGGARALTSITDAGVTFGNANIQSTTNNAVCIPLKIYGVKGVIIEKKTTCEPLTEYFVEKGAEETQVDTVEKMKEYLDSNLGVKVNSGHLQGNSTNRRIDFGFKFKNLCMIIAKAGGSVATLRITNGIQEERVDCVNTIGDTYVITLDYDSSYHIRWLATE